MLQLNRDDAVVKHDIIGGTVHVDGRALNQMLRGSTAPQKAVIAADLSSGRLVVSPLTGTQAHLWSGARVGYAYMASTLTEAARTAVINGQSLSALHNKPSAFAALARATNEVEAELGTEAISVGDLVDRVLAKIDHACLRDALDRLVTRYPNQVMAGLDRVTAPATNDNEAGDHRQRCFPFGDHVDAAE